MKDKVSLSIKLRTQLSDEQGQDLIEYALLAALIAFGSTATMTFRSAAASAVAKSRAQSVQASTRPIMPPVALFERL